MLISTIFRLDSGTVPNNVVFFVFYFILRETYTRFVFVLSVCPSVSPTKKFVRTAPPSTKY